jgi:hypothetical protein
VKWLLALVAALWAIPAHATIDAWNHDSDLNSRVYVRVVQELVAGHPVTAEAVVTIPPRERPGQWSFIHLCLDANFYVTRDNTPFPADCKPISAWGTKPRSTDLMEQVQTERHVQFTADYDFDRDYGVNVSGNGAWSKRGNAGGWPPNRAAAIYLRGQAGKREGGNGQINFSTRCDEGSTSGGPNMQMRAQVRGYSSKGNTDAVEDHVRVVISRSLDGQLCVMINRESFGLYLNSGFDLML